VHKANHSLHRLEKHNGQTIGYRHNEWQSDNLRDQTITRFVFTRPGDNLNVGRMALMRNGGPGFNESQRAKKPFSILDNICRIVSHPKTQVHSEWFRADAANACAHGETY
jgi:hypothetical protein